MLIQDVVIGREYFYWDYDRRLEHSSVIEARKTADECRARFENNEWAALDAVFATEDEARLWRAAKLREIAKAITLAAQQLETMAMPIPPRQPAET